MKRSGSKNAKVELKESMTRQDIRTMVWNLVWPSITEMFLVSLLSIADMIMASAMGAIFILFGPFLISLYNNNPEVIRQGTIASDRRINSTGSVHSVYPGRRTQGGRGYSLALIFISDWDLGIPGDLVTGLHSVFWLGTR